MKKSAWLIASLVITALLLQGSQVFNADKASINDQVFKYPSEVKKVIDQKCYGCHSEKGKSEDARKALMWDDLPNLEKSKVLATLDGIIEVLEDGAMPPEDVVKKYPEMKLHEDESTLLKTWAESKADSLMK